ncbi:MAG: DbpA RNA binding domain-containing protein, partial [Gammaproteobacteria bacterium]|nr:DbpA RNA binding domain-containing protein [Gammaproteobacteria bacterium]
DGLIILVRTKHATVELAEKLEARGYASSALNGDMNQALREKTVDRLKRGSLDILVATDVVARGLDVERITHVVNYDIPHDTESYVHRIGRTGRAGRTGDAILFVAPRERRMLRSIERATGQEIKQMQLPSRADISNRRVEQFKQSITDAIESQELNFFEELIEGYQAEHNIGLSEIAAALAYMVQSERPLIPEFKDKPERQERSERSHRDRDDRRDRPRRERRDRDDRATEVEDGMIRYRIEVGYEHDVMPKNIVGAIANEVGMESSFIGRIKIFDDYSTVDLPDGLPGEAIKHLKNVWVCNRKMNISKLQGLDNKAGKKPFSKDKKKSSYSKPDKKKPKKPKKNKAANVKKSKD